MSYRDIYEAWLASPILSPEEIAERQRTAQVWDAAHQTDAPGCRCRPRPAPPPGRTHRSGCGSRSMMGQETDEKFLANVMAQVNDKAAVEKVADTFKMVYTPFHGTGYKLIPEALKQLGMKHVICYGWR